MIGIMASGLGQAGPDWRAIFDGRRCSTDGDRKDERPNGCIVSHAGSLGESKSAQRAKGDKAVSRVLAATPALQAAAALFLPGQSGIAVIGNGGLGESPGAEAPSAHRPLACA